MVVHVYAGRDPTSAPSRCFREAADMTQDEPPMDPPRAVPTVEGLAEQQRQHSQTDGCHHDEKQREQQTPLRHQARRIAVQGMTACAPSA